MQRIGSTSWFIEENRAIKLCDKTVFVDSNTVIPIDTIRDFFCPKDLNPGETVSIDIRFNNEICKFDLVKEQKRQSTTMMWKKTKVSEYLKDIKNLHLYKNANGDINLCDYTLMSFTKNEQDNTIELIIVNKDINNNCIFKKNIDISTLKEGITVPKASKEEFLKYTTSKVLNRGSSQKIKLRFDDYESECELRNIDRKKTSSELIQIRYSSNKELIQYLSDTFKYSEDRLNENSKIEIKESIEFYPTDEVNTYYVRVNLMKSNISNNEIIINIKRYIQNKGYIYTLEDISNLYLSLKTKPFVILAGISGTGKSKIVRLLAESLGATSENNQFNMISVRPDWNDSTELIGYKNLEDKFIEGYLTKIIQKANENKNKPYFVCLDEMNLARVEYYLSDYLSIIESRKKVGQDIITDNLIEDETILKNTKLNIPDNLYLIGTVNMDDTTFQFSRKVLDRANTIEFSDVDLENLFGETTDEDIKPLDVSNEFLKTTYLKTLDIEEDHREYAKTINKKIVQINEILKKSQKQFAYRVRDEILFYMIENKKSDLLEEDVAFDYQIMQKILPAITGSESSVEQVLIDLFNFICKKLVISDLSHIEEAENYLQKENVEYKNSAEKIIYMLKGYSNDGYVSYWY